MQGLSLIVAAVLLMVVIDLLVVLATLGAKVLRSLNERRLSARRKRLERALTSSLASEEIHPNLKRLGSRDLDLLATLMVEYLSLLRGAERDRVLKLAETVGLVERYFDRLRSRRRWQKARAAENLGYFGGPEVVAPLTELLAHRDETLRAVAARALARIGTSEAAEALVKTLNDPSELTRLRMAENLERIGPLAAGPLVEALENGNPSARVLAARVLGNLRAFEIRPALREAMLGGSFDDLRAQAALALGKIGDPQDVPALLEASADESWPIRAQVANALGMIGETSAIPTLQSLSADPEWWVRLNASLALANMGPTGERALAELLESEDHYARDRAAATLEERGIIRRMVEELVTTGERGERARAMIRAMVRAGAIMYLERLARTFPAEDVRGALRRTMIEARDS